MRLFKFLCENFITGNAHFKMCVEKCKNGLWKINERKLIKKDNLISIKNKSKMLIFSCFSSQEKTECRIFQSHTFSIIMKKYWIIFINKNNE